jgi:hypothetical protein
LAKKRKSDLNIKQELFIKHYLMSFNQRKAAIEAGYSPRTADAQGSRLLKNVKVEEILNKEMARLRERMSEDANRIYAGIWQEVNEITERINAHYQAEKKIKQLIKKKNVVLFAADLDTESQADRLKDYTQMQRVISDLREIKFEREEASFDLMKDKDFLRAQELRAKLLHDLFDRAGYKPTDKLDVQANVSGGISLSHMTDEELEKEAAKLV